MSFLALKVLPKEDEKTKGGIYIPARNKTHYTLATIYAIGFPRLTPDGKDIPSKFREGDRVILQPYVGNTVVVDGEHFLVAAESDVICRIEGAALVDPKIPEEEKHARRK